MKSSFSSIFGIYNKQIEIKRVEKGEMPEKKIIKSEELTGYLLDKKIYFIRTQILFLNEKIELIKNPNLKPEFRAPHKNINVSEEEFEKLWKEKEKKLVQTGTKEEDLIKEIEERLFHVGYFDYLFLGISDPARKTGRELENLKKEMI